MFDATNLPRANQTAKGLFSTRTDDGVVVYPPKRFLILKTIKTIVDRKINIASAGLLRNE